MESKVTDIEKFEDRNEGKLIVVDDANSPFAMTKLGLAHGQSLADIEKMLELQIRWEENEAKKAYHRAMAAFKANPPKIWRDMQVKYKDKGGNVQNWSHSDLGIASEAISKSLGEHGLNYTWRTEPQDNKETKVTCIIYHELGHSESTWLQAGPDTTGSKNAIQAIGSTIFYLERYTLFALTGLAPARMDDDGNAAGTPVEYITLDQQTEINDFFDVLYTDNGKKFLKWLGAKSVDTIPIEDYKNAIDSLKDIKAERKKPKREPGDES